MNVLALPSKSKTPRIEEIAFDLWLVTPALGLTVETS